MTISTDIQALTNRIDQSSANIDDLLTGGIGGQTSTILSAILTKLDILRTDLVGINSLYSAFFATVDFIDPYGSSSDKIQCYHDELENYGVSISDDPDNVFNSPDAEHQLGLLLTAVYTIAHRLGVYKTLLPAEAFQRVMGPIEFLYDDDPNNHYALTAVPEDTNGQRETATIMLVADSFLTLSDLGDHFVVVHELGHVFHNRHGNAVGGGTLGTDAIVNEYVASTNADWFPIPPGQVYAQPQTIRGVSTVPYTSDDGTPLGVNGQPANAENPQAHRFLPGTWITGDYNPLSLAPFFPNETTHPSPHPKEGFADSFATLMIRGLEFFGLDLRGTYITNIDQWINEIMTNYP